MEDTLVSRRSKRSTAGNRMEAALAEMSIDDLTEDVEEDIDFVAKADEEPDQFESDFASTDEEAGDEDAAEKALEEEEKRAKRAARQKSYKVPKAPARKVTFDSPAPDGEEPGTSTPRSKLKPQRRVSLGQVVDAETGEVLETNKRKSTREATRQNTQELQSRLKHAEGRRASISKRPKDVERRRTQADLIAAALDMEEENIKSHRDYLMIEEEKRKKARVTKPTTVGPKIRWRSRAEDVTITVYDPVPQQPYQVQRPTWSSPFAQPANLPAQPGVPFQNPYAIPSPGQPSSNSAASAPQQFSASQYSFVSTPSNARPVAATNSTAPASSKQTSSPKQESSSKQHATVTPTAQPYTNQYYHQYSYYGPQTQSPQSQYQPYGPYYSYPQTTGQQPPRPHLQLHPQTQIARKTIEKQAKNYVDVLIDEERPRDKPAWRETMDALFGKHADWDNLRVYVGKNRPVARQIQICPITGLQARYRDPRTGVPYANAGAFRILTRLLAHEYVWSPSGDLGGVGVYVGHEKQRGAIGVPDSWGHAMAGVEEGWRKKQVEGRKEEKTKEKEVRVGERRSSRIAGEAGDAPEKVSETETMDVDVDVVLSAKPAEQTHKPMNA